MAEELLTQKQLARRWALSERTLERWRCIGKGPTYVKLGHHVRYRLTDIKAYEQEMLVQRSEQVGVRT
jgi:predicted DNA-binding transcriptional regulator AlpA